MSKTSPWSLSNDSQHKQMAHPILGADGKLDKLWALEVPWLWELSWGCLGLSWDSLGSLLGSLGALLGSLGSL